MGKRILIVDDDVVSVKLMESRLTKSGYEVLTEPNGVAALECVRRMKPDIIVLDVEMPEMNGYTFVGEMSKDAQARNTPVIVLTGHEENRSIFARKGFTNYFLKPVNFHTLIPQIEKLLGEKS